MVVGTRSGTDYVKAGQIILAINESGESGSFESAAYINANHVNISATNTAHLLAGSIVYDSTGKLVLKDSSGAGVYIERQGGSSSFGIWDKGNLTGGIMVQQINGQSNLKLVADVIDIDGLITALAAKTIGCGKLEVTQNIDCGRLYSDTYIFAETFVSCEEIRVGSGGAATWKSATLVNSVSYGTSGSHQWAGPGDTVVYSGSLVTWVNHSTTTINYLGK